MMDHEIKNDLEDYVGLRAKLTAYGKVMKFKQDEVVLSDHSYVKGMPIVISGNIRVMRKDDEGREILLYYIKSGESCIMSLLGGMHQEQSQISAVADDEVELLFIPNDKVQLLLKEDSQWVDYIFKLYHKRFEELLYVINSVAFKKMDARILDFLKEKKEILNSNEIIITHHQLAEEIGSARVVVSRLLKQLENEGVVALGRNKITLL